MARQYWKPGNMLYPLPVAMVSCADKDGNSNIITVAWAGTICTNPAMLSISVRPERYSYNVIKETKEFVVNLVTKDLVYAADFCGVKSGRDVDKFEFLKLHQSNSVNVKAPGIEESPVNIECKVRKIDELGSHHMFIADVVSVNIDDKYMDKTGKFNLNKSDLAVYSHGEYFALGEKQGSFGYSISKKKVSGKSKKRKS
ncbi:MAG: flavin reductase family protein [Lachnospiraceae bacterium]|nr:flavin reductase family protein [Lachnospiraceae bacterium]